MNYQDLIMDPRPDLTQDSHLWTRLFMLTPLISNKKTAETLLRRLWTMRSIGTAIRRTHVKVVFDPLFEPDGDWPDKDFFEQIKFMYLLPFETEIKDLLNKL